MVGARIPVQGLNSSDFVEVYEFLSELAGNIVIGPPEVTSKSGQDFDYDKIPFMMPTLRTINGKLEFARHYTTEEAKSLHDKVVENALALENLKTKEGRLQWRQDPAVEDLVKAIFGSAYDQDFTEQEINDILREQGEENFEEFLSRLNGPGPIQNRMITAMRNILEMESNFKHLIQPNDTGLVKPLADEIRGDTSKEKQGTRIFEPLHNLKVQQSNLAGEGTIGIGAKSNKFNSVYNAVGLHLNTEDSEGRRVKILMPHNKKGDKISLSDLKDVNGLNIGDVISQLMNGWVDVEKDDWIAYIQGNKEIAPVMLFLVQAGVPIKKVVKFVTNPLVRDYAEAQRLMKGSFAEVLGKGRGVAYRRRSRNEIFKRFGIENPSNPDLLSLIYEYTDGFTDLSESPEGIAMGKAPEAEHIIGTYKESTELAEALKNKIDVPTFEKELRQLFLNTTSEKEAKFMHRKFTALTHPDKGGETAYSQVLNDTYDKYKSGELRGEKSAPKPSRSVDYNFAVFLHYLELEALTQRVDKIQQAFNVDTNPLQSLTEFYAKVEDIEHLSELTEGVVDESSIGRIKNSTVPGTFYNQKFVIDLFGKVLPIRNSAAINDYLTSPDERLRFYQAFKNDLFLYIFQNQVRTFPGRELTEAETEDMYKMPVVFTAPSEYLHYLDEFEKVKAAYPGADNVEVEERIAENTANPNLVKVDETKEEYKKRIEALSYQEWARDKALMNIMNPFMLFKGKWNVGRKYEFIVNKFPGLKQYFSILNNIKVTSKDGIRNMMLATMKFDKDELNVFHENLKDLANGSHLLTIPEITQKDADYISDFFKSLPLYLYMQTEPTPQFHY